MPIDHEFFVGAVDAGSCSVKAVGMHGAMQGLAGVPNVMAKNASRAKELGCLLRSYHRIEYLPHPEWKSAHVHVCRLALRCRRLRCARVEGFPVRQAESGGRQSLLGEDDPA